MKRFMTRWLKLIMAFLLYWQSLLMAQQLPTSNSKEDPIKLQLLRRNLEMFSQSLPDTNYLQRITLKVSANIIAINQQARLFREDSLKNLSIYELKYLETQQKQILKDIENYKGEAIDLQAEMEGYHKALDTLYGEVNKIQFDSLVTSLRQTNSDSLLSISQAAFIENYKRTEFEIRLLRNEVAEILSNLRQEASLLTELKLIQIRNITIIEDLASNKLGIRSLPIWSIERKDNFTNSTLSNFKDSLKKITFYLQDYTWRFYVHLLIYFAILGIALFLKKQHKLWERYINKENEIVHLLRPLRSPNTSSFLLTLSLTNWVHHGAPADFFDIVLMLLPIPILVFIYRFKLYALFREGLFFSTIFILIHFQHFIVFNSLFHRIMLVMLALLMVYAINRIKRNYQGDYLKTFKYLFWVSTYGLYLAILANVVGYFEFSQFVINQVSASIVLGALFHISSFVVFDIFKLLFLSDQLQGFKSVEKNYVAIKKSLKRIINILAVFAWLVVVLKNSGFYEEVTQPILTFLDTDRMIGSVTYSISGLILFCFTIYLSTKLSRILEEVFKEDYHGDGTLQKRNLGAITIMVRYGVITIGLMIAVAFSGLPVENITIIIGALGVGIGFGLQNIFNNLVSGFILAVEKPIQIGDIVQVDTFTGEVQDIGIRASKVKTFNGAEVIIPNGDLIASNVINWTHSDRYRRIEIFVGVAYGTDTEKVIELLKQAINQCTVIRRYPEPIVVFHNFGESSLDFRVLCWTQIEDFLTGRSDLSISIDKLFKEHHISIPFPQRDLYIKSVDKLKFDKDGD